MTSAPADVVTLRRAASGGWRSPVGVSAVAHAASTTAAIQTAGRGTDRRRSMSAKLKEKSRARRRALDRVRQLIPRVTAASSRALNDSVTARDLTPLLRLRYTREPSSPNWVCQTPATPRRNVETKLTRIWNDQTDGSNRRRSQSRLGRDDSSI